MIRLAAAMAWIKQRTAEYRITNFEGWNRFAPSLELKRTEYIPSTFDILFFRVSFPIKLAAFWPAAPLYESHH
jgi:hypothetical protein